MYNLETQEAIACLKIKQDQKKDDALQRNNAYYVQRKDVGKHTHTHKNPDTNLSDSPLAPPPATFAVSPNHLGRFGATSLIASSALVMS